jgi:hypothetical protein
MKGESYGYLEHYINRRRRRYSCCGIDNEENEIVKTSKAPSIKGEKPCQLCS